MSYFQLKASWISAALWLAVIIPALRAQTPSAEGVPTFKARSELVTVPVVVTDKSGVHIEHLTKEDFVLLEDGKPQKVATFEEITRSTNRRVLPAPGPNQFSNVLVPDAVPVHLNILVLDLINTPFESQAHATQQLLKYLQDSVDSGQPTSLFMINRQGLKLVHDFTADPEALAAALKKIRGRRELVEQANQEKIPLGTPPAMAQLLEMQRQADQRMESLERRNAIVITLQAMQQIAQFCAGLPGRKAMLWASGGFPFTVNETSMVLQVDGPKLETLADVIDLYEKTWRDLNQAQVALYPVDVRGLVVSNLPDISIRSPRDEARGHAQWMQTDTISTFKTFAEATGGRAFYNTNDLATAFRSAAEDNNSYYVLSYYLDRGGKKNGWHKLNVRVQRDGTQVRARSGFFLTSTATEKINQAAIKVAVHSPINSTAIPIRGVWQQMLPAREAGKKRAVFFLTMPANFTEIDEGDNNHMQVEFVAIAFTDKGDVAGETSKTMDAHLKPESLKQVRESGVDYRGMLELPAGEYTVHFVVEDHLSGRIGSVLTPLKVAP